MNRIFCTVPLAILSVAALTLSGPAAHAWNGTGHMTVAELAYHNMTQAQRDAAYAILKNTPGDPPNHAPGFSDWDAEYQALSTAHPDLKLDEPEFVFLKAAIWPDDIRASATFKYDLPDRHYIDLPYVPTNDVPGPPAPTPNILTQIASSIGDLRGTSTAAPPDRAAALCWLEHLTGDISQPLHATNLFSADLTRLYTDGATSGDRGGNRELVSDAGHVTKLHAFWDDLLGEAKYGAITPEDRAAQDYPSILAALASAKKIEGAKQYSRKSLEIKSKQTPADWANESNALAKSDAYSFHGQTVAFAWAKDKQSIADFPTPDPPLLPDGYKDNAYAAALRQIAKSGYWLQDELTPLLAGGHDPG